MTRKKRFIARIEGDYIIDKKVRRNKKAGEITSIKILSCEGMKPNGAVKFYEDEKNWLEINIPEIEWEVYDG